MTQATKTMIWDMSHILNNLSTSTFGKEVFRVLVELGSTMNAMTSKMEKMHCKIEEMGSKLDSVGCLHTGFHDTQGFLDSWRRDWNDTYLLANPIPTRH